MKQIIIALLIFASFSATAQIDSTQYKDSVLNSYAGNKLALKLPVKAINLFAYYYSVNNSVWANRNAPNGYKSLVGSNTKPDSLVNVSVTAKDLTEFAQNLQGERYGAAYNYNRSIFENVPAITGYTALNTQVVNQRNSGTTEQKNAAEYVIAKYGAYTDNLTSLIDDYILKGKDWIKN